MRHKVAITGIGTVSCLGANLDEIQESLRLGRSGISHDPEREELGFFSSLTGTTKHFYPKESGLSRKQRNTMPEFAIQAYAATHDALDMAGLTKDDIQNPETGIIFGNDSTSVAQVEQVQIMLENGGTGGINSGYCFKAMNSTITLNLNAILGVQGASWTLSSACSSGGHAIGQASDLIAMGRQDRVICGGAQEISWQSLCSFDALEAFSRHSASPEEASRPFAATRDGLVPSGGAATLILERYDLAIKRGAPILGEVEGYGFSSDGNSLCRPHARGLELAMRGALKNANCTQQQIDLVSAHATSTPIGDAVEAEALINVFGKNSVPVTALKSLSGHELWMSGASQIVYSILQARGSFIAGTTNFSGPDDVTAGLNIQTTTVEQHPGRILHNAAGFGGTNSCLIVNTRLC